MFYRANPLYAVIIIILFLGLYLLYKRRKSTRMHGGSGLFSGRASQQNDIVDLVMIQQLLNYSKNNDPNNKILSPRIISESSMREIEIEKIKKEVLSQFDS